MVDDLKWLLTECETSSKSCVNSGSVNSKVDFKQCKEQFDIFLEGNVERKQMIIIIVVYDKQSYWYDKQSYWF